MVIKHYHWHVGTWAWVLHRISGVALVLYLPVHIWVTHYVAHGPEQFNQIMETIETPFFKTLELALLAAVLYHAFNGLRVILVELGWIGSLTAQRVAFWIAGLACLPILAYAGWRFLHAHGG
ncbi:MAG: succinate dehydrogenase, cytochrome b556 subunit [Phycisphaerae bacterium]